MTMEQILDADGDPFLGMTIGDRFVVLAKIGAGSMGTVYRARQEAMGRDVAIKILRSDRAFDSLAKARFAREARAMSLLTSPHTATVFDFGEIPEDACESLDGYGVSPYFAMELLDGESVGARLKRQGRIGVEEAVRVAHHALLSLAEAHTKGIIHRDLKPDNLILTRSTQPDHGEICKVLDFGIAKIKSTHGAVDAFETQAGTVFGTPRYMSPEQAQGKALDARSDLYALGVVLYHMLVGRPPFVDEDAVVVMARHIKSVAVSPHVAAPDARIGPSVARVVMQALAKEPDQRPATAMEFIAVLDRAMLEREKDARAAQLSVGATASGEVAAMVHDGLNGPGPHARRAGLGGARSPWALRGPMTSRWAIAGGASMILLVALSALAAFRLLPPPVPLARASVGLQMNARRLAVLRAQAAPEIVNTAPVDPPATSADTVPIPPSAAESGKGAVPAVPRRRSRYWHFE